MEEEDVEAELEELIRADNARDLERLPEVPQRREGSFDWKIVFERMSSCFR